MSFTTVCAFVIIFSLIPLVFSKTDKELSTVISSVIFITVMLFAVSKFPTIFDTIRPIIESVNFFDVKTICRVIGASFFTLISVSICEASGQKGLVVAIEILSTFEILNLFFPMLKDITMKLLEFVGE